MRVLISSTAFIWDISHSKKNWARYDQKYIYRSSCTLYPFFLPDLSETWIFSTIIFKIFKFQISWKYVQCEPSCSIRMDGQTEGQT